MNSTTQFELRFQPLNDQLSDRTRNNYSYARAMVGRELAVPAVRPASMH
jgi:hypothetical protein